MDHTQLASSVSFGGVFDLTVITMHLEESRWLNYDLCLDLTAVLKAVKDVSQQGKEINDLLFFCS